MKIFIENTFSGKAEQSEQVMAALGPQLAENKESADYCLRFSEQDVSLINLREQKQKPIRVDFDSGKLDHRRKFGGGKNQMISKAVGLSVVKDLHVLDATAGLGADAFVLACLSARVDMVERSAVAHSLLCDGLARARVADTSEVRDIAKHMQLFFGDSTIYMSTLKSKPCYDVVYLDPMFPERQKKKSAIKKEMLAFQNVIEQADDHNKLLASALEVARYRVVVKRPIWADPIADSNVTYALSGKTCRYDVYVNQKLPS